MKHMQDAGKHSKARSRLPNNAKPSGPGGVINNNGIERIEALSEENEKIYKRILLIAKTKTVGQSHSPKHRKEGQGRQ